MQHSVHLNPDLSLVEVQFILMQRMCFKLIQNPQMLQDLLNGIITHESPEIIGNYPIDRVLNRSSDYRNMSEDEKKAEKSDLIQTACNYIRNRSEQVDLIGDNLNGPDRLIQVGKNRIWNDTCPICLETFQERGHGICMLSCGHTICDASCITSIERSNNNSTICPICRSPIHWTKTTWYIEHPSELSEISKSDLLLEYTNVIASRDEQDDEQEMKNMK